MLWLNTGKVLLQKSAVLGAVVLNCPTIESSFCEPVRLHMLFWGDECKNSSVDPKKEEYLLKLGSTHTI